MFNKFDIIVQHRAGHDHQKMIQVKLRSDKHRKMPIIIHNTDDLEYQVPKSNPLHDIWYASGKDKMSLYQLKHSDLCITTTNKLASNFKYHNKNTYIFKNTFDWNLPQWNLSQEWLEEKHKEGKVVIGWAGLTSHMKDLEKMMPILKWVHDKYPNTHFILAGMPYKNTMNQIQVDPQTGQKSYKEVPVTDERMTYKYRVKELYGSFDPTRIEFLDVLSLAEYGKFYSMFDIGVAYIEDTKFNHSKSAIKVNEYMAYNSIPLFSYVGGYKELYDSLPENLKDINYAIMMNNNEFQWKRKFETILDNIELYKDKAKELKEWNKTEYDIFKQADEYATFFDSLIK